MTRYLLDTNILSDLIRNPQGRAAQRVGEVGARAVCTSIIVAAELRFGAEKLGSSRFRGAVEAWLSGFQLLDWPLAATHHYARLRRQLETRGTPVGNLDLMIAAHALAEDSVVITNNAREFHRIPGVAVEEWRLD